MSTTVNRRFAKTLAFQTAEIAEKQQYSDIWILIRQLLRKLIRRVGGSICAKCFYLTVFSPFKESSCSNNGMNPVYRWVVSLELQLTEQKTSKKHPCSRCLVIWSVRMPIRYWTWQEEGGVSKTNEWWIGTVPEFGLKSCCSFVKWFVANLFCHWGIVPLQDLSDFYNHSKETLKK